MKRRLILSGAALVLAAQCFLTYRTSWAYIEAPHTLGRCCHEATHIVSLEVTRVDKAKGLIIYKKLEDLKGSHPQDQIKHNIGQRGFHEREWKNVMAWAEVGKKAVFFHNGGASETCIDGYWYQCYPEGEWWGMSHAEPYLLRTYRGDPEKLAPAVKAIVAGREVVVPCFADGANDKLHLRQGKLQRMKASLKRIDFDTKRDFVGFGAGDGEEEQNFDRIVLLPVSSEGWKYQPAAKVSSDGNRWRELDYNERGWREGKAPIGYGEDEIAKRKGTTVAEKGVPFVFRRSFEVSSDLLATKGATFNLSVASDDSAVVYLNGQLVDEDPVADHEFQYWNRDLTLGAKQLRPGRNVVAVLVKNAPKSSDIYLDMEISSDVPAPKPPKSGAKTGVAVAAATAKSPPKPAFPPSKLEVDKARGAVSITCFIAPRKLAHLNEIYPIEVIAAYPDGQKAHETVVVFSALKPSDVHKALESLGLKPGKPARGEGPAAVGPEVKISLELPGPGGKAQRVPLETALVDRKTGKPLTTPFKWHFTGSALRQLDPEKPDKTYTADATGTLITIFPVTDDTVFQSSLTMKEEASLKMETNKILLPKEGAPAKLVIEAGRSQPFRPRSAASTGSAEGTVAAANTVSAANTGPAANTISAANTVPIRQDYPNAADDRDLIGEARPPTGVLYAAPIALGDSIAITSSARADQAFALFALLAITGGAVLFFAQIADGTVSNPGLLIGKSPATWPDRDVRPSR